MTLTGRRLPRKQEADAFTSASCFIYLADGALLSVSIRIELLPST